MDIKHAAKTLFSSKLFYILIIAVLATVVILQAINSQPAISRAERIVIDNFSDSIMPYMDELDYKEEGRDPGYKTDLYITFSLERKFGETNETSMPVNDIVKFSEQTLNHKLNAEELEQGIVSSRLMNKYIYYDPQEKTYNLDRQYVDKKLVSITPVIKYFEKSARKSNDDFIVTYEKYQFDTPYLILDCAAQNNISIPNFGEYIEGRASAAELKRAVTRDCANQSGKFQKELTVTYSIKDNHTYIKDIK